MDNESIATVKTSRARMLNELNGAIAEWKLEEFESTDVNRVTAGAKKIKNDFAAFEKLHVQCLEAHKEKRAREVVEEEYGKVNASFIKWREATDQWIEQNRAGTSQSDDTRSVTSRRSSASKIARRKAAIELQQLQEEERLIEEENKARLEAIERKRQAARRKAQLQVAALEEDTDQELSDDLEQVTVVEKPVQQLTAKPASVSENNVTSSSDATALMAEAVIQIKQSVQRQDMPKFDLKKFSGDFRGYMNFIRNFEAFVDEQNISQHKKLQFLIQNCEGEARACIDDCGLYGDDGYEKAREILKNRYGKPHKIARAFIDKLTNGPMLKSSDQKALNDLSIEMAKCELNVSQLGFNSDINNSENIRKVAKRLPYHIRSKWTDKAFDISERGNEPTFNDLTKFVERRAQVASSVYGEDLMREDRTSHSNNRQQNRPSHGNRAAFATQFKPFTPRERKCACCNGTCETLEKCAKFAAIADFEKRREIAQNGRACFNCLKYGHRVVFCRAPNICNVPDCKRRHHYMLHTERQAPVVNSVQCNATNASQCRTFLGIIPVIIKGKNGKTIETNALIDNGATQSFCHESVVKALDLPRKPVSYSVTTLTSEEQQHKGFEVDISVRGVGLKEEVQLGRVWSVKQLPISIKSAPKSDDLRQFKHLQGVTIPATKSNEVHLLIGTESSVHVAIETRKPERSGQPYAELTTLGWVVRGPSGKTTGPVHVHFAQTDVLMANLERMWTTDFSEKISSDVTHPSRNDKAAMKMIEQSCVYNGERYEVGLPWKRENKLPNNEYMARARLSQLHSKLTRDAQLRQMYKKQMDDNLANGFLEETISDTARQVWYLPHFAVTNPNKPGKVRVVFDGAAKFDGVSLNDGLHQGPDLLKSLTGLLMRFRQGKIALSADIEGMFNQVRVAESDRDALRVLWWPDGDLDAPVKQYRLAVQAFGLRSSPCIASYAVHRTADDNAEDFSDETIRSAKNAFYVDDFLKSVDDVTTAATLANEMTSLMRRGGFNLTKWLSNSSEVLAEIPEAQRQPSVTSIPLCDAPTQRALGIKWSISSDCFTFNPEIDGKDYTKRGLASQTASLFDPLGLVAPVTLKGKSIIQRVCKLKLDWDDKIPVEIEEDWMAWKRALPELAKLEIPRCYFKDKPEAIELHVFSDASTSGLGACAYLRYRTSEGFNTALVSGKAHVAPIKTVSVPRLELQASVVATRLAAQIKRELELTLERTQYWTDSQVVLGYINNTTSRFKTYVANRLTEIHEHTDVSEWRHIATDLNVADYASRGIDAADTQRLNLWLSGPSFLTEDEKNWPEGKQQEVVYDVVDVYATIGCTALPESIDNILHVHSSWTKLSECTAWLQRFSAYIKARAQRSQVTKGPLTAAEIQAAQLCLLRLVQRQAFDAELCQLTEDNHVNKSSCIAPLNPILSDDLIRVGGRLEQAAVSTEAKHPIILPHEHHVTELIIRHLHISNGHMGVSYVLACLRKKYWINKGRKTVKRVLGQCTTCKRQNGRLQTQIMAPLRKEQVTPDQPCFTTVGADYFGPFHVRIKRSTEKRYGCIFVCLASRAIHIEVAHSLSTDSLLSAIRRFESRRGSVTKIYSDNGTNFVGGDRELRQSIKAWNQQQVVRDLRQRGIEWHFNAPHSSESGGIWERQIRTVRKVLCSMTSSTTFTDEQLVTLMAEAERIVNNRPLTHVGDDLTSVITPSMLLTLKADSCLPPGIFSPDDNYSVRRYRQTQFLASVFWRRFMRHYLPSLQARQKWQRSSGNVRVGDIILLAESTARGSWPLARVTKVNTSRDGYVRSCEVTSRGSSFTRPISKILLLEAAK